MSAQPLRTSTFLAVASSLRIVLVPAVMALVLAAPAGGETGAGLVVAAVLFALAAVTDFLDGYLARRWEVTTTLGSFLDTTADKLLVTGVLVALVAVARASPWIATIIVGRELVIMGLRGAVAADGAVLRPSIWGKLKTNVQFLAILLAILRPGDPIAGAYADEWVMAAAALVTVGSAVDYLARCAPALRTGHAKPAPPAAAPSPRPGRATKPSVPTRP